MLITLAGLRLEDSGFTRPKPLLLLAYLALEGSRERRFLRDLFWPGEIDAATHLRVTLQRIRQAVPDALEMNGEWVACKVRTDAQDLLGAQEAGLSDRVLELYAGPFLAGANLPVLGSELEEWVYATRELLAANVQAAWMQRATAHARKGEFALCGPPAERAYLLSGAPEPDSDRLFSLHTLLLAGESPLASDVKREAEDAGATPYANLEAARTHWQRKTNRFSARLPVPTTSFVGRNAELETVRERLTSSDCRWVTLLGPGGMGKTRLALEMARQTAGTPQFPDGVFWVPLENITESGVAAQRIYETLVGPSNATGEPLAQVEDWLSDRSALLVLDNAEQVEGIGNLLERWAASGEESRWLVTSRERLQGQGEWVLALEGLPQGNRRRPNLESDAAKLFVGRSAQIKIGKRFDTEHAPAIVEVCELLDGMPLALELAATWMDVIEPAELAAELREDLRVLEQSGQGKQNLRVAFDRSWNKLSERERTILASLSIFEDGFTREAAQKITGATISDLFSLVNRSLIRATSSSRYGMHPVVRSYAREKLASIEGLKPRVQAVHDNYFFDFLLEHGKGLTEDDSSSHFDSLDREIDNILVAWLNSDDSKIEQMTFASPHLRKLFLRNAKILYGERFYLHSIHLCDSDSNDGSRYMITFRSSLAMLYLHIHDLEKARLLINSLENDRLQCCLENCFECMYSYQVEGSLHFQSQNYEKAIEVFEVCLDYSRKFNFEELEVLSLENIFLSRLYSGKGEENISELIDRLNKCTQPGIKANALNVIGNYYMSRNKLDEATIVFEKALLCSRLTQQKLIELSILNNIAFNYLLIGDLQKAIQISNECLERIDFVDNQSLKSAIYDTRGQIHLTETKSTLALECFRVSLIFSTQINDEQAILDALIFISKSNLRLNKIHEAVEILSWISYSYKGEAYYNKDSIDSILIEINAKKDTKNLVHDIQTLKDLAKSEILKSRQRYEVIPGGHQAPMVLLTDPLAVIKSTTNP